MKKVRIGIIGCGGIANGAHIRQLNDVKEAEIVALCDIDEEKLKNTAEKVGVDEAHRFENYKDLIACPDVDAVEICTPNHLHVPMAIEAVRAGKPFNCEKPLALDFRQATELKNALEKRNIPNMMCFSYRFHPAVRYAKYILSKGLIGKVISINVEYLKSSALWKGRRLEWRFIKEYAGTGVLGDLGVHLIDMASFLVGDFHEICANFGTVVKERQKIGSDEWGKVETDDYCNFLATIGDGVSANFAITGCALGNANTIKYDIFGTEGVISFNLNDPSVLGVCIGEIDRMSESLHFVKVPDKFKISQEQMFTNLVLGKECEYLPTVYDGLACQKILDAAVLSAEEKRFVTV